jgi:hypothetical protein
MNALKNRYKTEYGWSIKLPPDWERLGGSIPGVLVITQAIVFAKMGESSTSLTWMVRSYPVQEAIVREFEQLTAEDAFPDKDTVSEIVNAVFPLIGQLDDASIGTLGDGARVLETIESYTEGELKHGYQMIFPLQLLQGEPRTFQRICFYAPNGVFQRNLTDVRNAARSFRYD